MAAAMEYQQQSDPMLRRMQMRSLQDKIGASPERARNEGGIRPLTADEIVSAVERNLHDSLGAYGSTIDEQRRLNLRRMDGRPFGNEVEGQSKAQIMSVADTVEWMMPSIMRAIFSSGNNLFKFQPTRPDQEQQADEASDGVNHVFLRQLAGFDVIYDWVKTSLIEMNGFVAVYWDQRTEPKRHTYRGFSEEMIGYITSDPNVEVERIGPHEGEQMIDPITGLPAVVYDITIVRRSPMGRVRVDSIPPENMIISRRMVTLNEETDFIGYEKEMTVGDLIALGYPAEIVSLIPNDSRADWREERVERLYGQGAFPLNHKQGEGASRKLWVKYIYIRLDEDGDGYSELREIVCVGDSRVTILSDREVNRNPLVSITPIPMPHRFHGTCPASQAADNQFIASTVLRQMLDNFYRMNNSRYAVVEGEVNLKDLAKNLPGGSVRVDTLQSIMPLPTAPLPNNSFELLNYMQSVNEKRTGVSSWQQGPDAADMKYQTRGAVSNVATAAESKINLINLVFANTGLQRLGKLIYQEMCENYAGPFMFRLRGQWRECDPRNWDQEMDCICEVGQGVGEMEARAQQLMAIGDTQEKMLARGLTQLVSPKQLYSTARDLVRTFSVGHDAKYFTDPGDQPWPEQEPSLVDQVKLMESQRRSQEDQAVAQHNTMSLAVQASGQEGMAMFRREELAAKTQVDLLQMQNAQEITRIQVAGQLRAAITNSQRRAA